MKRVNVKWLVSVGMLSSIAYLLMLLEFPIPPFPPFLKVDFSDIPALIATFVSGPVAGIVVQLLKNTLNYFMTGSETGIPVGHLSNIIAGVTFILTAYFVYQKYNTKKGMTYGLGAATALMAILMCFVNYYLILPAYTLLLNAPALSAEETRQLIVAGVLPFNIIKGVIVSLVFILIFDKMRLWLDRQSKLIRA